MTSAILSSSGLASGRMAYLSKSKNASACSDDILRRHRHHRVVEDLQVLVEAVAAVGDVLRLEVLVLLLDPAGEVGLSQAGGFRRRCWAPVSPRAAVKLVAGLGQLVDLVGRLRAKIGDAGDRRGLAASRRHRVARMASSRTCSSSFLLLERGVLHVATVERLMVGVAGGRRPAGLVEHSLRFERRTAQPANRPAAASKLKVPSRSCIAAPSYVARTTDERRSNTAIRNLSIDAGQQSWT